MLREAFSNWTIGSRFTHAAHCDALKVYATQRCLSPLTHEGVRIDQCLAAIPYQGGNPWILGPIESLHVETCEWVNGPRVKPRYQALVMSVCIAFPPSVWQAGGTRYCWTRTVLADALGPHARVHIPVWTSHPNLDGMARDPGGFWMARSIDPQDARYADPAPMAGFVAS
jgi:hypothetical protein